MRAKNIQGREALFACKEKNVGIFLKFFFFWKNEPELVCWVFSIKTSPV